MGFVYRTVSCSQQEKEHILVLLFYHYIDLNPGPVILLKASHSGLVWLFPRDLDSRSVLGCRLGKILLSCPSVDDTQFDHLVQMVSTRYFHSTEPLLFCN